MQRVWLFHDGPAIYVRAVAPGWTFKAQTVIYKFIDETVRQFEFL